jgi:hypothetical protein
MMRKVIKPVPGGYCKEVWEDRGHGGGLRRAARRAPYTAERATGGRVVSRPRRPSE